MTVMLITVVTPDDSLDLSLPSGVPLSSLLDLLEPALGSPSDGWVISGRDGSSIEPATTLAQAGVLDGGRLFLTPAGTATSDSGRTEGLDGSNADLRAPLEIPARIRVGSRMAMTLGSLVGLRPSPASTGPIDRARRVWHWTDHSVRLRWLLSKPLIRRPLLIGVLGHRSDEVAEGLADALGSIRLDRVVLVDANAGGDLSRRLASHGRDLESIESALRDGRLTGLELDGLFARTRRGTPTVPMTEPSRGQDRDVTRRLVDSLVAHAGVVIVDWGTFESANTDHLGSCDQVVAATTGEIPEFEAQTIAAVWGRAELPRQAFAARHVEPTDGSMTELALVVASGWAAIGAATAVPTGY